MSNFSEFDDEVKEKNGKDFNAAKGNDEDDEENETFENKDDYFRRLEETKSMMMKTISWPRKEEVYALKERVYAVSSSIYRNQMDQSTQAILTTTMTMETLKIVQF